MIVDNIPQSTVVQMAAFQFGYRPLWVGSSRSEQRENINPAPILTRVGESVMTRPTQFALGSSVGWFVAC